MPAPRPVTQKEKRRAGTESGVVGAGGGTALTYLIQNMPDSTLKNVLLFLVPSLSVGLGVVYFFCSKQLKAWWIAREFRAEKYEFLKLTEAQLRDEATSPEYKNEIRKNLESFQKSEIDTKFNRLKSLQEMQVKFAQTADSIE
jgi:hypothetical protein